MDTLLPALSGLDIAQTRRRDTSRPIFLIGFQEQENLGIGYLAATLQRYGHRVQIFDFEHEPAEILRAIKACNPLIVGFSLIFQFYLPKFRSLIRCLRDNDVSCHFTMGGHFPSLSYQHALELIPELDTVVRYEGEETLLELADVLSMGINYRNIAGIAYVKDGEVVCNPLRALVHDLDALPYPVRTYKTKALLGRLSTHLLASRGCIRTCSFCSIHMFYRSAPGKVVRIRKPEQVVQEMRMLHEQHGISIFMFQDDDFPVYGVKWRRWTNDFVDELHRHGLPGRILWKINCRADAVEAELFARMRDAGLYLVYMGLESGNEEGLKSLHKQITVDENVGAVEILKRLGIRFEFGFMLFEPSTTFESIRQDLQFLRTIVGDGSTAATFCRMAPYDGTPIKETLRAEGRLRGDITNPYYDFLDPRIDDLCHALSEIVELSGWIYGIEALSPMLNFAWSELAVMERLFPQLPGLPAYRMLLRRITRESNNLLFNIVEEMSYSYSDGGTNSWSAEALREKCQGFADTLVSKRNTFVYRNQDILLAALRQEPVVAQELTPA
jgi:anaerobic magnesium-protoporphyrin IX monomethyl ester cyclase